MNSRDRVLTILDHKEADKVPVTNRFTNEIACQLAKVLGIDYEDSFDLEVALGHDMLNTKEIGLVNSYSIDGSKPLGDDKYISDFGIIQKKVEYNGGYYVEIIKNPLEDLESYSTYEFPDPYKQETLKTHFETYRQKIEKYGSTHVIVGGVTCTIFEGVEMLRGMERVMVDLIENLDFIEDLMDKLVKYHFKVGKRLIELGVDVLYIGDDVGMQTGMLISPDLWRKILKPRYDFLFREWKKINKDIFFALHSDGHIEPIVGDLVEVGLDILNPIQPGTMNDPWLKEQFGKKLTFWGGINVQKTIPFGSPEEVIAEVKDRIDIFGPGGGFIISPSHNVQVNPRSIDNTLIYYWACEKYGKYK